jgi:hypothetical protein
MVSIALSYLEDAEEDAAGLALLPLPARVGCPQEGKTNRLSEVPQSILGHATEESSEDEVRTREVDAWT